MEADPSTSRATPLATLVAIGLLSAAVLALEVTLTRILSVLTWHHFVFMILGTALLGFGAAGSTLSLDAGATRALTDPRNVHLNAYAFAASSVAGTWLMTVIRPEPMWVAEHPVELVKLLALVDVVALPFYFAGLVIGQLLKIYREDAGRLYGVDLVAGGLGSLASVALIRAIGAVDAVVACACLGGVAGWLLDPARARRWWVPLTAAGAALAVAATPGDLFFVPSSPTKGLGMALIDKRPADAVDHTAWHPVARIDVMKQTLTEMGGLGGNIDPTLSVEHPQRFIYQDGAAATAIVATDGDASKLRFLGSYLQAAPYAVRKDARVMVIGVGGGVDVLIALYHGARAVTGVEVNPAVIDAITERYDREAGGIFSDPRVTLVNAEGRHFASTDRATYDVIQLSGVDTFSALSSGAYALAEAHLYTREAVEDFWARLAPDGILSYSRWYLWPPRETLRLALTMEDALDRMGIVEPWRHLVVVRGPTWADTLLKRAPFTRAEVEALRAWAKARSFELLFDPFGDVNALWPAVLRRSPAGRKAFCDAYAYDVSPCVDDRPFFFDYYKWSSLWRRTDRGQGGYLPTQLPFALYTLVWALLVSTGLAALFILVPLRRRAVPGERRLALVGYFASLGLGFLFVEIVAIQKLMIFLGGPSYATAAVLCVVLVFSGAGSATLGRVAGGSVRGRAALAAGIALAILALDPLIARVSAWGAGAPFATRLALAALALAPVSFLLGVPFPMGIRLLARDEAWIPWAWAVNGFATVVGSSLCVLCGMAVGFSATLAIAAAVYLLGFACLEAWLRIRV